MLDTKIISHKLQTDGRNMLVNSQSSGLQATLTVTRAETETFLDGIVRRTAAGGPGAIVATTQLIDRSAQLCPRAVRGQCAPLVVGLRAPRVPFRNQIGDGTMCDCIFVEK